MNISTQEILKKLEPEEVYLLLLKGSIKNFPCSYWKEGKKSIERANRCIRYLIEDVLKWSQEDVYKNFQHETFSQYGLRIMLKKCFNYKFTEALESAYPGIYKPWLFKIVPRNYWTKERFIEALRWTIEEKLQIHKNQVPSMVGEDFMLENSLITGFIKFYGSRTFEAIDDLYPGVYERFEFRKTPRSYWSKERAIDALIWGLSRKKKFTVKSVIEDVNLDFIKKLKLEYALNTFFNGSIPKMIDEAFPGIFSIKNKNEELKKIYTNSYFSIKNN